MNKNTRKTETTSVKYTKPQLTQNEIIVEGFVLQNETQTQFEFQQSFETIELAENYYNNMIKQNSLIAILMYQQTRKELKFHS